MSRKRLFFRSFAVALVLLSNAWLVVAAADVPLDWSKLEEELSHVPAGYAPLKATWVARLGVVRMSHEETVGIMRSPSSSAQCRQVAIARAETAEALQNLRESVDRARLKHALESGSEEPHLKQISQKLAWLGDELDRRQRLSAVKGTVGRCVR